MKRGMWLFIDFIIYITISTLSNSSIKTNESFSSTNIRTISIFILIYYRSIDVITYRLFIYEQKKRFPFPCAKMRIVNCVIIDNSIVLKNDLLNSQVNDVERKKASEETSC